ncbi:hypothetical protein FOG48_03130 [Hanseniaspora uvarum]|nr:hypothetical protein FOG48_03130 [Hanseniaspora uvarum]
MLFFHLLNIFPKINITKYFKPDEALIHSTNISFDKTDEDTQKPYFTYKYGDLVVKQSSTLNDSLKKNLTVSSVYTYKNRSVNSDYQLLDQHICKNIEVSKDLIESTDFMAKFEKLIEKHEIKYCLLKNGDSTKDIWIDDVNNQSYNEFNTSTNVGYQLKLLQLKENVELIYLDVIQLMCESLPSVYCFESIELNDLKLIPFLYGFKKADYLHFIKTYNISIIHPDLYFYKKQNKYRMLLVTEKSNYTNLVIVKSLIDKLLLKIQTKKIYLKSFNNIFNDYVLSNYKVEFLLSNFSILHYLKNLMFDYSIGIEIVKDKYNQYRFTAFSTNEQNLLSFLKLLHFKIYDKILQFTIDFENKENFDLCTKIFIDEPSLTVLINEKKLQISLIGDRWDNLFKSYMKLNQKNIKYNFFIDLSNEFKEFIIGKKFGKINKIEKMLNNTCSISLLLPSIDESEEVQDTEFITIQIESDNFIESINCLKLVQQELPYERQLYIPESFHKYIIGMNGENIQSITRRYNCFIQFMNTFENKQNEFSFIRYPNVIIRCPLKTAGNVEKVIDANLQLCIDEIIKDYFPKKDKSSKYNMKSIQGLSKDQLGKLQRMMIWKYNSMVQKDKDGAYSRELIKRDIERYNAELAETRHLSLYKRTLKHGQVYKNTIVIEDEGNVYVVSITENGLLTVHEMIEEHVIKKFEKKMHLRLLNLIEIDHWDGLKFGLCTESDVLLICELQTHPFDINIVENIFSKFNICNKGLNSSSFKEFDVYSNDVLAYSDDAILIHYKDDYDLDEGDIIINEDAERQIILSAKFLKSENETSNYILTIEDYNFVKLYHIDRISGRLNKKAELKLSEYAIYMFLQVLPKDSIKQEDTSSGRANRRRKREHDIEHAIINGEDGRILLLEINLDLEDIKVVNNSKLPIPKSLLANNKKANKNTLPMIVCMQSQNIVDSNGSFILILTHIGDLLRVNITKSIIQDETSYDMNFSQFYKIEISKKFQFITGNNSFFVLPQFGIPKFYRINNLDTKEILQIKYDDAQFEYDSLDVLCEFPNHFLKTPLIKSEVVTDNNLEASVDGMDIFCKSFKLEEKMRINIVDEDHQQINDVFEIDYEGKSKLLFFSFSDSTRVLHFNEDDEIAEIDADDAVNSGVFILKETTVKVIKNENFLLQFTKNKLNIIKIVAADKFILFKRVNLKNLLPDILEYTSSIEITNSEIIKDSKQEILLISLNNYKFFYLDLSVFINQGTLSSYMILSEIDSFLKNWKIYKHSKKLVLLFTLTSDNVLNIYEIASTLLNGDTEGSDDPLVSKFFNNGINSFLITSVEDENIENISCHVGFNDGLYEVYKFDINEKNLETVYQTYLNVHPLSLHYLSNIGNGTETKSDTKEVDEVKIDTSTLSKSQKKRLKKKQQGKEGIPDKATTPKIDVDLESYEYNYLTLMNEQTFLNNQSSIKILKLLGRENYIFSILKGSIMTVFKLTNNRLEIVKENKTVPSLNQIVQIDFFYKDLLMVAADVVGNIVYHRYIPEKHVFIPLADYKLSNNHCQVLKFLDAKTILKTDRFGNLSVLALNISLSIKDLINMEHNGILERIYYDYEKHDFSKNRDDNVWDLPFKFDKVCSIYIGDIITTVEIVKENSKIRNSRPLILCFGLQGSVTLLMPLVDELEINAMKSVQEIVNTQEDNSYGVSRLRYESTFELTKNIYDADYHNNQNSLKKIDYKIFEILQSLQNASHLE